MYLASSDARKSTAIADVRRFQETDWHGAKAEQRACDVVRSRLSQVGTGPPH
jgi:hypothetical protein